MYTADLFTLVDPTPHSGGKSRKRKNIFNQSSSSSTQRESSNIPDSSNVGVKFAGVIATSASLSLTLDRASMYCAVMTLVFLMYTSTQSLIQHRPSLMYQPFVLASASHTQTFTLIE